MYRSIQIVPLLAAIALLVGAYNRHWRIYGYRHKLLTA